MSRDMRSICLFLLLAATGACSDAPDTKPEENGAAPAGNGKKKEPVSATTGITRLQKSHEMWAGVVEELGREKPANPARVKDAIKGIDNLIKALEISIEMDAMQSTKVKHAHMRQALGQLRKDQIAKLEETREIQRMLDDDEKGVSPLPAGHTRTELADNLSDLAKARADIDKRIKDQIDAMTLVEKAIAGGKPAPGDTMATRELEAVKALRKRAEALR